MELEAEHRGGRNVDLSFCSLMSQKVQEHPWQSFGAGEEEKVSNVFKRKKGGGKR